MPREALTLVWQVKPCARLSGCILPSRHRISRFFTFSRNFFFHLSFGSLWGSKSSSFPPWSFHQWSILSNYDLDLSRIGHKNRTGKLELLLCPLRVHGEEEGGKELDLGLLLFPRLDGVEEPHGVEQPHCHVAPFVLLPVHLQKKYCWETERNLKGIVGICFRARQNFLFCLHPRDEYSRKNSKNCLPAHMRFS